MKLKELSAIFKSKLELIYDKEEAQAIYITLVGHELNTTRIDLSLRQDLDLADETVERLMNQLKDLQRGVPLQYVTGQAFFFGLPFKVNTNVLIPRPETEELVAWILEVAKEKTGAKPKQDHSFSILDIGTGSGCIAISLKKNLPEATVFGLDISSEAIATARQNATINNAGVDFFVANILDPEFGNRSQFDIIVSNPPYITQDEKRDMHQNVLAHEPHQALFVSNEKPLIFYEAIAEYALKNLADDGHLFFEVNEHLGKETIEMLTLKGFNNIILKKDMQQKDRMICSQK